MPRHHVDALNLSENSLRRNFLLHTCSATPARRSPLRRRATRFCLRRSLCVPPVRRRCSNPAAAPSHCSARRFAAFSLSSPSLLPPPCTWSWTTTRTRPDRECSRTSTTAGHRPRSMSLAGTPSRQTQDASCQPTRRRAAQSSAPAAAVEAKATAGESKVQAGKSQFCLFAATLD